MHCPFQCAGKLTNQPDIWSYSNLPKDYIPTSIPFLVKLVTLRTQFGHVPRKLVDRNANLFLIGISPYTSLAHVLQVLLCKIWFTVEERSLFIGTGIAQ